MRSRPIEDFYLAADGDDWAPAVARAQAAWDGASNLNNPISLVFGSRQYNFLSKVDVYKRCNFIGSTPMPFVSTSRGSDLVDDGICCLYFSASGGFELHYPGTYSGDLTASAQTVHFEDMIISGSGTSSGASRHGVIAHCAVTMRNVGIVYFGGCGVLLHSNSGAPNLQPVRGNSNNSLFAYCRFQRNGTAGTVVDGGDTNCMVFDNCYWDDNGEYYAAGAITAATSAVYVKAASAAIASSSITSNVLTMNMGVAQSVHGYVVGDYVATSGLSANVTSAQVTGVSGNNITCELTSANNATNGAGTLYPLASGNTVKMVTVVLNTAADISKFDRGSIVTVTGTTLTAPYSSPGKKVFYAYSGVASGNASTLTIEGDSSLTTGAQADGVGTVTGIAVQLFDSSTIFNQYNRPFFGTNYNSGYGIYSEGSGKNTFIGPYTEGTSTDVFYNNSSVIINGNCDVSSLSTDSSVLFRANEGCLDCYQAVRTHNAYVANTAGTVRTQIGSAAEPTQAFYSNDITTDAEIYLFFNKTPTAQNAGGWWEWARNTGNSGAVLRIGDDTNTRGDLANVWLPGGNATNFSGGGMYLSSFNSLTGGVTASSASYFKSIDNGSYTTYLKCIGEMYEVTGCTSDGGTETQVTTATHTILDGERVLVQGVGGVTSAQVNGLWIVKDRTSTTIDLTGSTFGGTYTASTGRVLRLRGEAYVSAAPTSGTWALGDIAWNKSPSTEAPLYWVCTTAGTPGTWLACYPNHKAYTVTGSVTRGHMGIIRVPFTAGAGANTDVTIYAANCPAAMRIVQVYAYISTISGGGTQTIQLFSSTLGGGSALSGSISTASTGFKSVNTTATATTTVAAGGSIYLYRQDDACVGEFFIVTMEE